MGEKRISVYGKDAENNQKRMFDWVKVNGQLYIEAKDSHGHKIRTPAAEAISAYRQLKSQKAG
ncbi:MAG: hypothetical protein II719_04360 [Clostridia bacterium]|nr:hypothetical protein [Clostridia bacterium]